MPTVYLACEAQRKRGHFPFVRTQLDEYKYYLFSLALLEIIANFDRRHQLEFDSNQEAMLVRGARPRIDFN